MIELARRRMMMGGSAKPYDAEVEYLESTGTQWIDTGIAYNIDSIFSFDVDSEFTTSDTNEHLCTIGATKRIVFVGKYLTEYYVYCGNGTNFKDTIVPLSTHHIIVIIFPEALYTINGVKYPTSYYFTDCNGMSLPLFARRYGFDPVNPCHAKVRHFAIYKDGINVRDLIPVRKNGIGYMYDKVSGQLFGNQGTGQFIIGPDKGSITTITQQQQQEMYG